ncbi:MAG: UDP-N-acetylglucosamine 1-carboxyvinyltransferase [Nitrospirae bacterium]|nr:UDP-N-acetylglucosamine 1-carboxyvinyltransferase [Nitrospirota bacterium]
MDKIIIQGGTALQGRVVAAGAKNAALPILAATLLCQGDCRITNLPQVRDVGTMAMLLSLLGLSVKAEGSQALVNAMSVTSTEAPYDLVKTMRASILVLGPLLARFGEAIVSLPGGCAIGARPVNLHLKGLEALGAHIELDHGYIRAKASRLRGARISFDMITVTGTENLMMAACLAEGTTIIDNAAQEPEIVDLAKFLNTCGAKIQGAGSDCLTIEGVQSLHGGEHHVIPDRIESGTYLMAGAITGGDVLVDQCVPIQLVSLLEVLERCGAHVEQQDHGLRVTSVNRLKALDVATSPFPGFPTDLQAQMMALLCVADGTSVMTETVFEGRFLHVPELHRMGAEIQVDGSHARIKGVSQMTGAPVMASDLRASAGLILAGLAAEGETHVSRIYHLDRGYETIELKLQGLGASIQRVKAVA